jgi:hypothetical protein
MTFLEPFPGVKQLSILEKLKLSRLLAEDLESQEGIIVPLESFKTYD